MSALTPPPVEVSPTRLALGTLVTQQVRVLLERRAIRMAVVGTLLTVASLFALLPEDAGDAEWIFILPVAVAAIAAGLKEGLFVAILTTGLVTLFTADKISASALDETALVRILTSRFALYGIIATVLGAFAEAHYSVQHQLRQLASLDPLTKVSNIERFHHEIRLLDAANIPYAVLITDLDDLKALNDKYGHQAGSAAIQSIANVLRRVVRTTDLVARYGGDEFVVILREADRVGAQIVMNRVNGMLAGERLPGAPNAELTVSMGVALSGEDGTTPEELLSAADQAMYEQKRARKP